MTSTSTAILTCLCGSIQLSGSVLSETDFPTTSEICHCSSCRHAIGSLGTTFPLLKEAPPQDTLAKLSVYKSSTKASRYFCPTCGCHCFHYNTTIQEWFCLGGIIEIKASTRNEDASSVRDTVKVVRHEYVGDTVDGGLASFMTLLGGRNIPIWAAGKIGLPIATVQQALPNDRERVPADPEDGSRLEAKCHCGGVRLLIKRANYPPPDPSVGSQPRYVPRDRTRYLTYFCACRSCRLSTGVSLVPWTTIPPSNILNGNAPHTAAGPNSLIPATFGRLASDPASNPALTLKHHWSSPDVCRSFCGTCGASISYWCAKRPDEVDVLVGILRSEEGSMAQSWLEWDWGRCSFPEEATDKELYEGWLKSAEIMKRATPNAV